jgi:hypothetical protein
MILDYVVTNADRLRYPSYADGSIRGIRIIKSMTSSELLAAITYEETHEAIRNLVGSHTNPLWVTGQVLEELMERDQIGITEFTYFNEMGRSCPRRADEE